jgi:predicted AlkP superfamily phosphohydrolase/phosphomutase
VRAPRAGVTTLWVLPWVRERVHRALNPASILAEAGLLERDASGRPAWSRTLAYHVGHGQVWVNLRGREPEGIVQPGEEHHEVLEALRRLLADRLSDPAAECPAARVRLKEEVYSGASRWRAPDLVVLPESGCGFSAAAVAGQPAGPAIHAEEGVTCRAGWCAVTGRGAGRTGADAPLDIRAVAPTAAAALAMPPLARARAPIERSLFGEAFWATRPAPGAPPVPAISADEQHVIARRLADLGYLT